MDSSESAITFLDNWLENSGGQKIYVHTDKTVYYHGDTIWYKAYLVSAISHAPNDPSEIIYVELIDQNKNLIYRHTLMSNNSYGEFSLPPDAISGEYYIRSYTNFMLNGVQDDFFNKTIILKDILSDSSEIRLDSQHKVQNASLMMDEDSSTIRMFPEGGHLVYGLSSKVAVEYLRTDYDSNSIQGEIYNQNDELVTKFKFYDRGLAFFQINPKFDESYYCLITDGDWKKRAELPEINKEGYVLSVNARKKEIILKIETNVLDRQVKVLAHQRGRIVWDNIIDFDESGEYLRILPTDSLPSGIIHITLFDVLSRPLCERLVFVNNAPLTPTSSIDYEEGNSSSEVRANLTIDGLQSDELLSCSVSVFNDFLGHDLKFSQSMKSYLLLNSDLRGRIDDPDYFFSQGEDYKRSFLLDLTLMTHGWRKFDWTEMLKEDRPKDEYNREYGIMINGYTSGLMNLKKRVSSRVLLNIFDQSYYEESVNTDEEGNFSFGPFISQDTFGAFIQARRISNSEQDKLEGKSNIIINIEEKIFPSYEKTGWQSNIHYYNTLDNHKESFLSWDDFRQSLQLKRQYDNMMYVDLESVSITAKKLTKNDSLNKIKDRYSFYGEPSSRLILDDDDTRGIQSVFDLLRRVPGVAVSGSAPNQSALIRGIASINASLTPLYLINGVQVDESFVNQITPGEVLFIDVIKDGRAAVFGVRGANGVIAIYTGKRSSPSDDYNQGIISFKINGFYKAHAFYSDISSAHYKETGIPDTRTTVYWNPQIDLTGLENEWKFSFLKPSIKGNYILNLNGITSDGRIISYSNVFNMD